MSDDGVIKFRCEHRRRELTPSPAFDELNATRDELVRRGFLGVDENGIGFGNLSVSAETDAQFYITGSGTGGEPRLLPKDFAKVVAWDCARNWLACEGGTIASSESLTHAALYEAEATIGAIIHGHSAALWEKLLATGSSTSVDVAYGTREMAREVQRLLLETDLRQRKIFAMAGHENGLIAFGRDLAEALALLD